MAACAAAAAAAAFASALAFFDFDAEPGPSFLIDSDAFGVVGPGEDFRFRRLLGVLASKKVLKKIFTFY